MGDTVLKVVAKELKIIVRGLDTVARLGGDEFVILIEDLQNNQEAIDIAELQNSSIVKERSHCAPTL